MYICGYCNGTGKRHVRMLGPVGKCMPCEGTGKTARQFITCPTCKGDGLEIVAMNPMECRACKTTGIVEAPQTQA